MKIEEDRSFKHGSEDASFKSIPDAVDLLTASARDLLSDARLHVSHVAVAVAVSVAHFCICVCVCGTLQCSRPLSPDAHSFFLSLSSLSLYHLSLSRSQTDAHAHAHTHTHTHR